MRKPLSWKQRLSYAVNLSPVRVIFNSPEIEIRAMLAQRKVRASVYEENNPRPRAVYTGEQWTARIMGHLTCPVY